MDGLLRGLDNRRVGYLAASGGWAEDPVHLEDRLVHHVLFRLSAAAEDGRLTPAEVLSPFLNPELWPACVALGRDEGPQTAAALLVRGLSSLLKNEVLRDNGRRLVPDWRRDDRRRCREDLSRLAEEEARLDKLLGSEARVRLQGLLRNPEPSAELFRTLIPFAAEEERILADIRDLRRGLRDPERAEEAAGRILERIQPPLGIVTNTSPALLLPCLSLLADEELSLESGIPYAASVILSILRDRRSTTGLLRALGRFPLSCSKIRENIIYTLGCLREGAAVPALSALLDEPDEVPAEAGRVRLIVEQKVEAVWALGKIGAPAVPAIPALARCADHDSSMLKTCVSWTLGEVGRAQKEQMGGLDADVVIALLKLLKVRNRQVYEETVSALRKIDLPEFIHSLYLYHAGAVNLQGLLPAQRGLYELSETLHYLIQSKGRAIMAVTGDSGTGKTYFCRAVSGGFGNLGPDDILYLMRDSKIGQKVCNRILGLRWLKHNIDPAYYHDYPLSEEEDDPRAFLDEFLEENKHRKLIILDGCRDRDYFQRVVDAFYERGVLDLDVTFRATFSTRRLNLEEREVAMESVKTHLSFLEEPILEDTDFYREGVVLVYDFDNSVGARLNREETLELFDRQKIESWGGLIRLGAFDRGKRTAPVFSSALDPRTETLSCRADAAPPGRVRPFRQEERHIRPRLNDDLAAEPNLLETFDFGGLKADRLRLYAQNQVAGTSEDGRVFVLSFIDNRLFLARGEGAAVGGLALLGRDLAVLKKGGGLTVVSFERNEMTDLELAGSSAPACALGSCGRETIVSGHEDGSVVLHRLGDDKVRGFSLRPAGVRALACDRRGRICAGTTDGYFFRLDPESGTADIIRFAGRSVALIKAFLRDRILAVTEPAAENGPDAARLHILDLEGRTSRTIELEPERRVTSVSVDYDGRIIAGLRGGEGLSASPRASLLILDLGGEAASRSELAGHSGGTRDCLTMGPKVISCGREETGRAALRVWGTEYYVRTELNKLAIRSTWPSSLR